MADCKKMKHKKIGLRVIFKQSNLRIKIIEIVAIAKQNKKEVYREAEKRLGR
ncbi:hypothetical protein IGJ83_000362 [Enterococcus pernyi]